MKIEVEPEDLRPLVAEIVAQTVKQMRDDDAKTNGRIAWSEAEAAALLGLEQHVLRDERRRGRIQASQGPGRRVLYTRKDLDDYLASRRKTAQE
ncbi:MAG: helix-turn-helix domain-containing protein [Gemmataceae bacterium]